uniref:Protein kinase domain-containing protein n=1 Tax=Leersia perrieri TaxID=77586 RepID=A0A0D9XV70_9ORYZ
MIVDAAQTAKRNRETCQKLARHHPETRNPVEQLEETLRHTYMLILSCQDSSYLHSCFMGGKQVHQLREVQGDITFYLQLFPLVSFVDTTRTWERLLTRAHPLCIKGKLPNGLEIAVKRHDNSSHQGAAEFMAEIDVIPKLRRKNIIQLIGFYAQGKECILVYEYISNGCLASIIHEKKRTSLNWSKRLKIIEGMSNGLLYLHNHSDMCIVHRDIKASNILLDHEMNAKISDFGLARKLAPNATAEVLVQGTWGYADPEYVATGIISEKTDVYSFGIVLLEIISGKLCLSGSNMKGKSHQAIFPEFALKNRKKLHKLVDPSLIGGKKHERAQIMQCLRVAMLCIRARAEHRPIMSEVVTMLPSSKTPNDDRKREKDEIETTINSLGRPDHLSPNGKAADR